MTDPDIVVFGGPVHGMNPAEYADALRDRCPDEEIRVGRSPEEIRNLVTDARVVTGGSMDADLLARAENLQLFACSSAGTGHLDLEAFAERGVAVTNAAGVHGTNIAEHVLGWLLVFARRHHEGWRRQQRREWRSYPTRELAGSTVTVVGLGAIGEAVIERLEPFGVETLGVRYTPEKGGPTDEVFGFDAIQDALARADYLVLATPLTDETRGLISSEELNALAPDSVVVNVARGKVVDTDALVGALRSNAIRGAALDVTDPEPLPAEHPLWTFENVLITPHNAGHTPEYFERLADILAENLDRVDETGEYEGLKNQVR